MSIVKPALQYPEQIVYLLGANNYSWVHFLNGDKKLLAKPISYLEKCLPDFVRIHKTLLINPACVTHILHPPHRKLGGQVGLYNGERLPVSRRRWAQVMTIFQNRSVAADADKEVVVKDQRSAPHAPSLVGHSIFFVTGDSEDLTSLKKQFRERWPSYQFKIVRRSALLPDLLSQLPVEEYPTLLFLDARTNTQERLNILHRLKSDEHYGQIPVIVLVTPADSLVVKGYQEQANSVVTLVSGSPLLDKTVIHICQFWLDRITLPSYAE